ncbi:MULTISPECIES: sugar kinase [unclassified Streptomyces]|uniref:sugar kinase n=1 Tax=unclassified Streptomyces TaxID=2593676 RepID=UPI001CBBD356|nr:MULTISPECIES: sugar kinase [unclassified Streptomyces]WPO70403.1 sugar kinase [Streptomyces sp. KN37]
MTVPRQPTPPDLPGAPEPGRDGGRTEDRRHMIRRRWLTATIIVLLIGIPAGYLVISANQSRNSGRDKEDKYSATGLTEGWPSRVQRRLYDVPIPPYSAEVAYYETNNWRTSRLYVQFLTSNKGLDKFLTQIGTSSDKLEPKNITISKRDQKVVGWEFTGPGPWSGLTHEQKDPVPTLDVVVDRANAQHPMVYVVSTTTP